MRAVITSHVKARVKHLTNRNIVVVASSGVQILANLPRTRRSSKALAHEHIATPTMTKQARLHVPTLIILLLSALHPTLGIFT